MGRLGSTRRQALRTVTTALGGLAIPRSSEAAAPRRHRRVFVLVHGAWHGGWCWRRVGDALETAGHKVFTPTLTGLADRSHLLSSAITLDTHIADVVNLIRWESLGDIVLCGHSYAGFVISGVVEQLSAQVSAVAFLDAYLPTDGQTMFDVASPNSRESIEAALKSGAAVRPAPQAASFNVNEHDRSWVDAKLTPQPVAVSLQKIRLTGAIEGIKRKAYVRAARYANPTFEQCFSSVKERAGWQAFRINSGHDMMVDAPDELTRILLHLL